jgi:NAD(P)-dependent dehydrogenase (short-subunit alcohol dehydrogenase family)
MSYSDIPRTAVITGAGSGLGRAMALTLAREGFKVGAADIDLEGARETVEMVRRAGSEGEAIRCDVRSLEEVQAMADHFFDAWGEVGIIANNAGVADVGYVGDIPLHCWQRIMETSLWGVIYGCHAFLPRMKASGAGHVINTGSAAGFMNLPEMAPYNIVKAGVISLSETLRVELTPFKVGVTVLCPSFITTNLDKTATVTDPWQGELVTALFENAKVTPEEISEAMLKAVKRNRLYVVPQFTPRWGWRLKRLNPGAFTAGFAAAYNTTFGKPVAMFFARRGMI